MQLYDAVMLGVANGVAAGEFAHDGLDARVVVLQRLWDLEREAGVEMHALFATTASAVASGGVWPNTSDECLLQFRAFWNAEVAR